MKKTAQHTDALVSFFWGVSHTPFFNLLALKHFVILSKAKNLRKTKCFKSSNTSGATPQPPEKTTAYTVKKTGLPKRKNRRNKLLLCLFLLLTAISIQAQQVSEDSKQRITLNEGLKLILFKEISGNQVYFVPTALQLSRENGKPEFSYQEYTKEGSTSPDGAILHFLLSSELTQKQLEELERCAKEQYGKEVVLAGALYLEAQPSGFTISNKTEVGRILNTSLQSKGNPPTIPNGKMALSFHIKKEDVEVIGEAFRKPEKLSGTNIALHYNYTTYTCRSGITTAKNNLLTLIGDLKKWF